MKQIYFMITVTVMLSTALLAMLPPQKKHILNLPPDVKREIQRHVLQDPTHNKENLEFAQQKSFATALSGEYTKSNTRNRLGAHNYDYLWQTFPHQISLLKSHAIYPGDLSGEVQLCLSTPYCHRSTIQADGPNTTEDILIAGHFRKAGVPMIYYHLQQVPTCPNKTVQKLHSGFIPNQRLVTMALAHSKIFAIFGQDERIQKQILSWYRYDDKRLVNLVNRSALPGALLQIAFITPNVLLGLASNKRLITCWLNEKKLLQLQFHKMPFLVEQFAVDSQNPDFVAFSFFGIETKEYSHYPYATSKPPYVSLSHPYLGIAVCSLKNRNSHGACLFKTRKICPDRPPHTLEFADGVIIIHYNLQTGSLPDERTSFWKVPAALFSSFLIKKI